MNDKTPDPAPAPAARTLADALYDKFKGALALFGSVAAVSAFLVFAGFLSDYGAYTLAGLPRLNFSLTGLAESGADVAIDVLALLTQGTRVVWMAALLGGVLWIWAAHRHSPRVRRWAGSATVHRFTWLLLLALWLNLFGGMVDRVNRSLAGEMHSAGAIEESLASAYRDGVPDPAARLAALERQGYELRFATLLNGMVDVEQRWVRLREGLRSWLPLGSGVHASDETRGFMLRTLPESRSNARHLFGWISLGLLVLIMGLVLCGWWGQALAAEGAAVPAAPPPRGKRAAAARWGRWLNEDLDGALARIVVPICWALALLSLALLPLMHGVLARTRIGGETVMVYLKPDTGEKRKLTHKGPASAQPASGPAREETRETESVSLFPEPTAMAWPQARFDCGREQTVDDEPVRGDLAALLDTEISQLNEAIYDYAQTRPNEDDYAATRQKMHLRMAEMADAVIRSGCAESVALMQQAAPAAGLAAQAPEVAEAFRRELLRVTTAYSVRLGTILSYPRDGQALVLAERVVPRKGLNPALWAIQGVKPDLVGETIVLPDLARRAALAAQAAVEANPDDGSARRALLNVTRSESMKSLLTLLERNTLHSMSRAAAITSVGTIAWVAAPERPDLSKRAIDSLVDLLRPEPSPQWPGKTEKLRAAAWTALAYSRNPYAADRVARLLESEPTPCIDDRTEAADRQRVACLRQAPSSIGMMLADLRREAGIFSSAERVPASLRQSIETMERQLAALITRTAADDNMRTYACSTLNRAGGKVGFTPEEARALLESIAPDALDRHPVSSTACIQNINRISIRSSQPDQALAEQERFTTALRSHLRALVEARTLAGHAGAEETSIRSTAFDVLQQLGLANETAFLFGLYLREAPDSKLGRSLRDHLTETSAERLGDKLVACADDTDRPDSERAHCLDGITHLKSSFDGDDGAALLLMRLARQGPPVISRAACDALHVFSERQGLTARRALRSDAQLRRQCQG